MRHYKKGQKRRPIEKPTVKREAFNVITKHEDMNDVLEDLWKLVYRYFKTGQESPVDTRGDFSTRARNPFKGGRYKFALPWEKRKQSRRESGPIKR